MKFLKRLRCDHDWGKWGHPSMEIVGWPGWISWVQWRVCQGCKKRERWIVKGMGGNACLRR